MKEKVFITRGGAMLALVITLLFALSCKPGGLHFSVSYPEERSPEALDGRLYLLVSTNDADEPRLQIKNGQDTQLIFGIDVEGLAPGEDAFFDGDVLGYPIDSIADIPPGEYWVQALLHRYETFRRSDGHTLKLPINRDEGVKWNKAPGNLYSTPRKVHIDPGEDATIEIPLNEEIPPIPEPEETEYVKYVRFESELLSEFWGRPMYLDAIVLLPEGFEEHPEARYPLMISQGHYRRAIRNWRETPPEEPDPESTKATGGNGSDPSSDSDERPKVEPIREALRGKPWVEPIVGYRNDPTYEPTQEEYAYKLYQDWTGPSFPRVIKVDVQAATPYYDGSYGVNSANNGPYGDAVTYELIPFIEKKFRGIGEGWARALYGGSTGGWTSLAFQIFYPDEYNGTWSSCPSPVDFRAYTSVNIYEDKNAFRVDSKWKRTPRPGLRNFLGDISCTLEELYRLELVLGTRGRSGELRDGYEAAWAPVGEDGYIKTLIDKRTGAIDPSVAEHMKEHYDLRHILERDWKELGPKLIGKLHIYCGDMDNYYLPNAVYLLEDFLESTTEPYYAGEVDYGDRFEHCWSGDHENPNSISRLTYVQRFVPRMVERMLETAPPGADTTSWRY
jgi:hypothetical protein